MPPARAASGQRQGGGDRLVPPGAGSCCPENRACATSEANTLPEMPLRGGRGRTYPDTAHMTMIVSLPNQHPPCRGPCPLLEPPPDQRLWCAGALRVPYRLSPLCLSFPARTRALSGCGGSGREGSGIRAGAWVLVRSSAVLSVDTEQEESKKPIQ